jgi:hypothetical protein
MARKIKFPMTRTGVYVTQTEYRLFRVWSDWVLDLVVYDPSKAKRETRKLKRLLFKTARKYGFLKGFTYGIDGNRQILKG